MEFFNIKPSHHCYFQKIIIMFLEVILPFNIHVHLYIVHDTLDSTLSELHIRVHVVALSNVLKLKLKYNSTHPPCKIVATT